MKLNLKIFIVLLLTFPFATSLLASSLPASSIEIWSPIESIDSGDRCSAIVPRPQMADNGDGFQ